MAEYTTMAAVRVKDGQYRVVWISRMTESFPDGDVFEEDAEWLGPVAPSKEEAIKLAALHLVDLRKQVENREILPEPSTGALDIVDGPLAVELVEDDEPFILAWFTGAREEAIESAITQGIDTLNTLIQLTTNAPIETEREDD